MLFINNHNCDPYFNLAAEEYFLKYFQSGIIMLWRSNPSVVVGKHQNAFSEINTSYVFKNSIPVVRRLSGGGTVYHDNGNVNFTFIRNIDPKKIIDFAGILSPVKEFLMTKGIDANLERKNSLYINGLKISGNAQHILRGKVLHHGTLLFSSDLNKLDEALRGNSIRFADKAIKSVSSNVLNIGSILHTPLTPECFVVDFKKFLFNYFSPVEEYYMNDNDILMIEDLKTKKYTKWEWNFGYSPEFIFKNSTSLNDTTIDIEIKVKNGICKSIKILVNGYLTGISRQLCFSLNEMQYNPDFFDRVLYQHNFMNYRDFFDKWKILGLFF